MQSLSKVFTDGMQRTANMQSQIAQLETQRQARLAQREAATAEKQRLQARLDVLAPALATTLSHKMVVITATESIDGALDEAARVLAQREAAVEAAEAGAADCDAHLSDAKAATDAVIAHFQHIWTTALQPAVELAAAAGPSLKTLQDTVSTKSAAVAQLLAARETKAAQLAAMLAQVAAANEAINSAATRNTALTDATAATRVAAAEHTAKEPQLRAALEEAQAVRRAAAAAKAEGEAAAAKAAALSAEVAALAQQHTAAESAAAAARQRQATATEAETAAAAAQAAAKARHTAAETSLVDLKEASTVAAERLEVVEARVADAESLKSTATDLSAAALKQLAAVSKSVADCHTQRAKAARLRMEMAEVIAQERLRESYLRVAQTMYANLQRAITEGKGLHGRLTAAATSITRMLLVAEIAAPSEAPNLTVPSTSALQATLGIPPPAAASTTTTKKATRSATAAAAVAAAKPALLDACAALQAVFSQVLAVCKAPGTCHAERAAVGALVEAGSGAVTGLGSSVQTALARFWEACNTDEADWEAAFALACGDDEAAQATLPQLTDDASGGAAAASGGGGGAGGGGKPLPPEPPALTLEENQDRARRSAYGRYITSTGVPFTPTRPSFFYPRDGSSRPPPTAPKQISEYRRLHILFALYELHPFRHELENLDRVLQWGPQRAFVRAFRLTELASWVAQAAAPAAAAAGAAVTALQEQAAALGGGQRLLTSGGGAGGAGGRRKSAGMASVKLMSPDSVDEADEDDTSSSDARLAAAKAQLAQLQTQLEANLQQLQAKHEMSLLKLQRDTKLQESQVLVPILARIKTKEQTLANLLAQTAASHADAAAAAASVTAAPAVEATSPRRSTSSTSIGSRKRPATSSPKVSSEEEEAAPVTKAGPSPVPAPALSRLLGSTGSSGKSNKRVSWAPKHPGLEDGSDDGDDGAEGEAAPAPASKGSTKAATTPATVVAAKPPSGTAGKASVPARSPELAHATTPAAAPLFPVEARSSSASSGKGGNGRPSMLAAPAGITAAAGSGRLSGSFRPLFTVPAAAAPVGGFGGVSAAVLGVGSWPPAPTAKAPPVPSRSPAAVALAGRGQLPQRALLSLTASVSGAGRVSIGGGSGSASGGGYVSVTSATSRGVVVKGTRPGTGLISDASMEDDSWGK